MKKVKEFTPNEIIDIIRKSFEDQGYNVDINSDKFQPARVPIYCKKYDDERIIEYTIDKEITKGKFIPPEQIDGVEFESSPVKFYQYYFPTAKVYFAFPHYVEDNEGFHDFKHTCNKNGIGLLKVVAHSNIEVISESIPLLNLICAELGIKDRKKSSKLEFHLRNCLHYFIYYPTPVFKRRSITGKARERMSLVLIDKLVDLKNIQYKDELIRLSNCYRQESQSDLEIAGEYITELWNRYLGIEYPSIQKRAENILQRDKKYREHFVHQFQVFLIGSYILDSIYNDVSEKFQETHGCKIEDVWLAASTFHDFSYGLQKFDTWLMEFFEEILRIKSRQTKRDLNLLNLDAAMIREALYDQIEKIVEHLGNYSKKKGNEKNLLTFFYEKAIRDRNHGVLSAITLLKLFGETNKSNLRIQETGIIEAATAIACHDEDIWEAISGCQGYLRSHGELPINAKSCSSKCGRSLWPSKKIKIYSEILSHEYEKPDLELTCEDWERRIMEKRILSEVKFRDNPILFLLIFCDTVQDEGRVSSSDNLIPNDRSSLENISIINNNGKSQIKINLISEDKYAKDKELEIERLAWLLRDTRFSVFINQNHGMKMNGGGGL
jgi:hypothetical protein